MNTRNIDNNPYNLKQTVAAPAYLSLISYPRRVFKHPLNVDLDCVQPLSLDFSKERYLSSTARSLH
jgi:hypothetical protein